MAKLLRPYTITFEDGNYTITWSSVLSPISFAAASAVITQSPSHPHYYDFGTSTTTTTLDWRQCTSPLASEYASRALFVQEILDMGDSGGGGEEGDTEFENISVNTISENTVGQ